MLYQENVNIFDNFEFSQDETPKSGKWIEFSRDEISTHKTEWKEKEDWLLGLKATFRPDIQTKSIQTLNNLSQSDFNLKKRNLNDKPYTILVKLSFSLWTLLFSRLWHSLVAGTEQTNRQSSGSNFQWSNWQKVQFNTDLLEQRHGYLYRNQWR